MEGEVLLRELKRTVTQLTALTEIGKRLTHNLALGDVLSSIMEQVGIVLSCRNWSLLLMEPDGRQLRFELAVGDGSEKLRGLVVDIDKGIAGWCARERRPLFVPDVSQDHRFAPEYDELIAFRTSSILAAPLCCRDRVLGVMELVAGPDERAFTEADLAILNTFADFAAIAIDNAKNYEQVQELTIADDVTRLFNARMLTRVLPLELARAQRYSKPLAVLFLDLDHFKQVNDSYGHHAGSRLLFELGEVIKQAVRRADVPVRFGGDEFVIILPETDREGAKQFAERLRRRINETHFLGEMDLDVVQTASFGVAIYPHDGDSQQTLLRAADAAMYRAKVTRDAIVVADEK